MRFSIIHPSRSRPKRSFATISKWVGMAKDKNFDLVLSLDVDDPELGKYYDLYTHLNHELLWNDNENKSSIEAVNNGAEEARGNVLIIVSDDTDCPMYWDKILRDAIGDRKDFVMKTDDGIQKRIITMPIMDRDYFKRDGYIYNPIYSHSWADTELTEVAHLRGRVITRMDIKFPHNHYSVIGEQPDDLYKRNDLTHDRDRPLYQQRKKINFGL